MVSKDKLLGAETNHSLFTSYCSQLPVNVYLAVYVLKPVFLVVSQVKNDDMDGPACEIVF